MVKEKRYGFVMNSWRGEFRLMSHQRKEVLVGIAGGKPHSAYTDAHLRVLPIEIKSLGWAPSALSIYSHRMATPRQKNTKGQPQKLLILNAADGGPKPASNATDEDAT